MLKNTHWAFVEFICKKQVFIVHNYCEVLFSTRGFKQIPATVNKTVQRPNHQPTK